LGNAPLQRAGSDSSEISIGYGPTSTEAIEFASDATRERETGFVKVFVCTKYVNLKGFEQGSFRLIRQLVERSPTLPDEALWHSWVYILTTTQRLGDKWDNLGYSAVLNR
jgi:hypothetical protein